MSKTQKIEEFDPNGVGVKNNQFIGLPFNEEDAKVVLLPVPWDVTVSYNEGTASAPLNILKASYQLDLYDPLVPDAWKMGIFMRPVNDHWLRTSESLRSKARIYIDMLEEGQSKDTVPLMQEMLDEVNEGCQSLKNWVYQECNSLLDKGKLVGLIGGEHSIPLGYLEALGERYDNFGILQIDAHMDLRRSYEGFTNSHASIFYNALQIKTLSKIVQLGIRDCCEEEIHLTETSGGRIHSYFDHQLRKDLYKGSSFHKLCKRLIKDLPEHVYISFDIDGLDPKLCPHTGTPVPGGLEFQEALYVVELLVKSGRKIIGFDLCEVAGLGHEWDGNVGARLVYRLSNLMGMSME